MAMTKHAWCREGPHLEAAVRARARRPGRRRGEERSGPFLVLSSFIVVLALGCGSVVPDGPSEDMVRIEGGTYRLGSDSTERELGYRGSSNVVREYGWYDAWEADPHAVELASFAIDRTPVTQLEYAAFVTATDRPLPDIDSTAYHAQGFLVHPWSEVKPFRWNGGHPPDGIGDHPIVLVDYEDAAAYCAWRGEREGQATRLPTGPEWEAACRGTEHRTYAWGATWQDGAIVAETTFTAPVGLHPDGATPGGIHDLLGNVCPPGVRLGRRPGHVPVRLPSRPTGGIASHPDRVPLRCRFRPVMPRRLASAPRLQLQSPHSVCEEGVLSA